MKQITVDLLDNFMQGIAKEYQDNNYYQPIDSVIVIDCNSITRQDLAQLNDYFKTRWCCKDLGLKKENHSNGMLIIQLLMGAFSTEAYVNKFTLDDIDNNHHRVVKVISKLD